MDKQFIQQTINYYYNLSIKSDSAKTFSTYGKYYCTFSCKLNKNILNICKHKKTKFMVLDKTLKGIRDVRLDNRNVFSCTRP